MALPPFFDRVYGAIGGHLGVSRDSLNQKLADIVVGVSIVDDPNENEFWTAELAVNLLARLYPRISLTGDEATTDKLRNIATGINPLIEFVTGADISKTISIGLIGEFGPIHCAGAGWVVHLPSSVGKRIQGPSNPYTAGASACLACAELFRRIFVNRTLHDSYAVSLLDFSSAAGLRTPLAPTDLPDIVVSGIGAVGNAALWAWSRDPTLSGSMTLVDPEVIELSNLQRYVLSGMNSVGESKVLLGQRQFSQRIRIRTSKCTFDEYMNGRSNELLRVVAVSVDNVQARRAAQAVLPELLVSGWTGEQAMGASWHVFSRNSACLSCLYHPRKIGSSVTEQAAKSLGIPHERILMLWVTNLPLLAEDISLAATALGLEEATLAPWLGRPLGDLYTDVVCGAVPLDVTGVGKLETVPLAHQSALAGILMAAELVKRISPSLRRKSQAEVLVSWDNVLDRPPAYWRKPRAKEPGCICGDSDYLTVYRDKWATRESQN